ncbi:MAG: hypothetical protein IJ242_13220 [Clostridia bacterium]|nr:hypothetical protein [Clostridia bacterium]
MRFFIIWVFTCHRFYILQFTCDTLRLLKFQAVKIAGAPEFIVPLVNGDITYPSVIAGFFLICTETDYDAFGNVTGKTEYYHNSDGKSSESRYCDANGNLTRRREYLYDEEGKITGDRYYDGDGNLQTKSMWVFDENGNRIGAKQYRADDTLQNECTYITEVKTTAMGSVTYFHPTKTVNYSEDTRQAGTVFNGIARGG